MARTYTLKRRAERQAETRRRIVKAAVELHGTLGPARTSLSQVAERAGVQRNTLYAHFPDERSLHLACSAEFIEGSPPPDPTSWRDATDGPDRLRLGLTAVYAWYSRNAELIGCVLRDADHHALTREITELRLGPTLAAWRASLGAGLSGAQSALLALALDFNCWRVLAREGGLGEAAAADAMTRAIVAAPSR